MKYNVLYVDPPWCYNNKRTGGSMKSGASAKYQDITVSALCALPIPDLADQHAVLFLWATVPLLPEALAVMNAWGFRYKTLITWVKTGRLGLGYWFRGQTEHLLLGTRGKVKPFRMQHTNIVVLPAERHSKKPDEFRSIIDSATSAMPQPRKLEVFARSTAPGWTAIGNEIDGLDISESIQRLITLEPQP